MRLVCPEESLYADNLSVVGELLVSEGRFKRERRGVLKSKVSECHCHEDKTDCN